MKCPTCERKFSKLDDTGYLIGLEERRKVLEVRKTDSEIIGGYKKMMIGSSIKKVVGKLRYKGKIL